MNERAVKLNAIGCRLLNEKDYVGAYKYFYEAARLGDENANYNLGYCHFCGYGVPKNFEKAFSFLYQFVDKDSQISTRAEFICGLMFHDGGYGLTRDVRTASEFYYKAMSKGHERAMFNYGKCCAHLGDYLTGINYIEKAMNLAKNDAAMQSEGKSLLKILKRAYKYSK